MREIKLFVVSDDRHGKYYIQAQIGQPSQQDDVVDLGFDARGEHQAVHNLLQAIGAEVNRNMTAIDPDHLPATRREVAKAIADAIDQAVAPESLHEAIRQAEIRTAKVEAQIKARRRKRGRK